MIRKIPLVLLPLVVLCACLSVFSAGNAYAYSFESDFYFKTFELVGTSDYYNATEGCSYRVPISEAAYSDIIRVEYDVVKLQAAANLDIELDENHRAIGYEYLQEKVVVNKSDLIEYEQGKRTPQKDHFFIVTAHSWCAFIFTVYYNGAEGETAAYDSEILKCDRIDDSIPEAYFDTWVYDSGEYVFNVIVRGNKRTDTLTANSGIKSFSVLKSVNSVFTTIDEVTNTGSGVYHYQLTCPDSKAAYYFDIIDNVGNGTRIKVVEFNNTSYDAGFESAVTNVINMYDTVYSDFSDGLKKRLSDAYYDYYLAIQGDIDEDKISAKMTSVRTILAEFARLLALKEEGKNDYTVVSPFAEEYFGGEITLYNEEEALADQKYGDAASFTISVAKIEPTAAAKQLAKVASYDESYAFTISLNKGEEKADITFDVPLKIRIPKRFDNVVAVQESATFGLSECDVTYGNGYTEISVPYSDGRVYLMIGERFDLRYLWFLTAVPVIAAVIVAVIIIKKKKTSQKEESK